MELGSCVLDAEVPVDAGLSLVSFHFQCLTCRHRDSSLETRFLRQPREKTLNSISAIFSQLPCWGCSGTPASWLCAVPPSLGKSGTETPCDGCSNCPGVLKKSVLGSDAGISSGKEAGISAAGTFRQTKPQQ